jgi:hypothetical protein
MTNIPTELGVSVKFEEISVDEAEKLFATKGLPPHLALATAELCGALGFEEPILTADEIVQASAVSCPPLNAEIFELN